MPIAYQSVDLNNAIQTEQIIQSTIPDYILHLASSSSVSQSWQNPALCFKNNTDIMLNILEAVRKQNLKTRILSIGSSEEYGEYASQETVSYTHLQFFGRDFLRRNVKYVFSSHCLYLLTP